MPAPIFTTVPYYPDHDTWADSFLKNQDADATLPPGFPKELGTKMAWDGRDLSLDEHTSSDGTECVLALNDSQLAEIDAALRYFQGKFSFLSTVFDSVKTRAKKVAFYRTETRDPRTQHRDIPSPIVAYSFSHCLGQHPQRIWLYSRSRHPG